MPITETETLTASNAQTQYAAIVRRKAKCISDLKDALIDEREILFTLVASGGKVLDHVKGLPTACIGSINGRDVGWTKVVLDKAIKDLSRWEEGVNAGGILG